MWGLSIGVDLSLFGMIVEIIGALLLAVEAIGVDRVSNWAESSNSVAGAMANGVRGRPRGTTVVAFVFIAAAYFIGGLTSEKFDWLATKAGYWRGAVGFLIGLFISYLTLEGFRIGLLSLTRLLKRVSRMTKLRTAAIYGSLLLVAGFLLQFLGTLEQAWK